MIKLPMVIPYESMSHNVTPPKGIWARSVLSAAFCYHLVHCQFVYTGLKLLAKQVVRSFLASLSSFRLSEPPCADYPSAGQGSDENQRC